MNKLRNKKNSKRPHISYKYIIAFCATFAICNSFVEKIASKNEGKNNPHVQSIKFNQVQSYNPNIKIQKFSTKTPKNTRPTDATIVMIFTCFVEEPLES